MRPVQTRLGAVGDRGDAAHGVLEGDHVAQLLCVAHARDARQVVVVEEGDELGGVGVQFREY